MNVVHKMSSCQSEIQYIQVYCRSNPPPLYSPPYSRPYRHNQLNSLLSTQILYSTTIQLRIDSISLRRWCQNIHLLRMTSLCHNSGMDLKKYIYLKGYSGLDMLKQIPFDFKALTDTTSLNSKQSTK